MIDNHVSIVGRVYEKELRYTKNGNAVLNLRVGVKDNAKTPLTMLDVVMWGKIAEQADKMMTDKCRVLLEGVLRQDRWENNEGQKRTKLYIKSNRFLLVESPVYEESSDSAAPPARTEPAPPTEIRAEPARPVAADEPENDNEIPF
jgi:single-strand DNA-binding protein